MVRISKISEIDKGLSNNYKFVADNFYQGAEVASEYEYWNAAGVLIVHSAIAYGDAVTIRYSGKKSRSEDHNQIVNLIGSIVPETIERRKALLQLSKIIAHKNAVSYHGDIYSGEDIQKLWKHLNRFKSWAEKILET